MSAVLVETQSNPGPQDDAPTAPASPDQPPLLLMRPRWEGHGGVRELLAIAAPMIISQAVNALNMFFDRIFLARYDSVQFAAALQGGVMWWTTLAIPFGLIGYVGTFVAQYTGAGEDRRVGAALWQAIWLALPCALYSLMLTAFAPSFFAWVGHEGNMPQYEAAYFMILCAGSLFVLLSGALSAFYTGRGKTRFVLLVNTVVLITNCLGNWWFIFHGGPFGLVPTGIAGAAWATVLSTAVGTTMYAVAILRRHNEDRFATRTAWRVNWPLMRSLLRFGFPAGVSAIVDMVAFTTFLLVAAKFGTTVAVATNVAMNLNALIFIPIVGLHIACQTLAGQAVGARRVWAAERTTSAALYLSVAFFAVLSLLLAWYPEPFVAMYRPSDAAANADFERAAHIAAVLLVVVGLYSMFDGVCLVISGTLRGAGDTRFVMLMSVALSQVFLTAPCLALAHYASRFPALDGALAAWGCLCLYIVVSSAVFIWRYRQGRWRSMSVIANAG